MGWMMFRCVTIFFILILFRGAPNANATPVRHILVFIALCDNEHQRIAPVPAAIGNGADPERNLYWGCSEGFKEIFGRGAAWKLTKRVDAATTSPILREYT